MSYCRFSCDDFQSDVYAYETEGGYQIHVAAHKIEFCEPLPEKAPNPFSGGTTNQELLERWVDRHRVVLDIVDRSKRVPIGLSNDGQCHHVETIEEMLDFLVGLKSTGYRVPDHAFMFIENEIWESKV